jgi:hypothetical protein
MVHCVRLPEHRTVVCELELEAQGEGAEARAVAQASAAAGGGGGRGRGGGAGGGGGRADGWTVDPDSLLPAGVALATQVGGCYRAVGVSLTTACRRRAGGSVL